MGRHHEDDASAESLPEFFEAGAVQVLAPPVAVLDGREIEAVDGFAECVGDGVAGIDGDRDVLAGEFATFAPNLVAPLAPKIAQVILEGGVAAILPVVLDADAPQERFPSSFTG